MLVLVVVVVVVSGSAIGGAVASLTTIPTTPKLPLPLSWKEHTHILYTYEEPDHDQMPYSVYPEIISIIVSYHLVGNGYVATVWQSDLNTRSRTQTQSWLDSR